MVKCSFCGSEISLGTGKMLVKIDGTTFFFCNSKCESNFQIRNPRHVKWTETYRKGNVKTKAQEEKK